MPSSSLLSPWPGPFGGVPPFDKIKARDFAVALAKGMQDTRKEIAAIANAKAAPTFENTIVAYENCGRSFGRVANVFGTYTATMNDKTMQAIETAMAPQLAAFSDEITQNAGLFKRIAHVWGERNTLGLSPEQVRLIDTHYQSFARRGAALNAAKKKRLAKINQTLAVLFTKFSQNQLADEETQTFAIDKEDNLAGLPDSLRGAMKMTAEARKQKGRWLVVNTRSSAEPFLVYSDKRDLRKSVWKMWVSRGDNPGKRDNKPIIAKILALRAERAKLLGYKSHAHWIIADGMAKKPEHAMTLMSKVWDAAIARVREEVADMEKLAGHPIEPWDYRYYAEKVRKDKYDLDENEVKNYLQLDHMREAMFWAAGQLYGLTFTLLGTKIPVYHPEVTVYEVRRGGAHVGLWYFDPYARDGKRSGAWMSEYRTQESFATGVTPIVSNNANFVKGAPGEAVLISWDDAVTLFHEFGHALHGLLSQVTYPSLAGTNTKRDFVEFPSQLNEHWLTTPEILTRYCVHHETGKPIPDALVAKIMKAKTFNQGFKTVEYLLAAIYDLEIHQAKMPIDPAAFEKKITKKYKAPKEIVMRHRPPAFAHIFSDDGYSAGYYSYIWADTLTADASEAFKETNSYYTPAVATKLHDHVMSVGNSVPPDVAFRAFRGRDVDTEALMRERGFSPAKEMR